MESRELSKEDRQKLRKKLERGDIALLCSKYDLKYPQVWLFFNKGIANYHVKKSILKFIEDKNTMNTRFIDLI